MRLRGENIASISKATGIAKSTLSDWTAGGRKPILDESIILLARHLGVSVEKLITGSEPEEEIADNILEQLEKGFVTLHSGVYRLKVEKFTGKKRGGGK